MRIKVFRVQNFRRLKDVVVDLDEQTTVFVGANNTGKTSATHVFQRFLGRSDRFEIYDFSADCWATFDALDTDDPDAAELLPVISLDLWFDVDDANIHRVVGLLPSLSWDGELIGLRMAYGPRNPDALFKNYRAAREVSKDRAAGDEFAHRPWPLSLTDYLRKRLTDEFEIFYYVLDERFCDESRQPMPDYIPHRLGPRSSGAGDIAADLIRVDFLDAQRHLSDSDSRPRGESASSRGRAENLSHRLGAFYKRNLRQYDADPAALSAIAGSEAALNDHYADVFAPILQGIAELGYPGTAHPELLLKASFNPAQVLAGNARVHYALPGIVSSGTQATLPDQYNGLGFKNLIYMAVELLDFHQAWTESTGDRPPVHLIMIEEPEAHQHAQLQQVFIRKVFELLPPPEAGFSTQLVVTTHSSHMLYESNFTPIRYFSRSASSKALPHSEVKDLSVFHQQAEEPTREFLQKYVKLTHCDLFFADAVILVEGNVERLLLPLIIERYFPELGSVHLTILEVGGDFAHVFEPLLAFLGVPALIITDLDSVRPTKATPSAATTEDELADARKACLATVPGAVTSNKTLIHWLKGSATISDLLDVDEIGKVIALDGQIEGTIRLAYQTRCEVSWAGSTAALAGRTLEEAFALRNLAWTQDRSRVDVGLRIRGGHGMTLEQIHRGLFNRVRRLDKTVFALRLMSASASEWEAPQYILDGLAWLRGRLGLGVGEPGALGERQSNVVIPAVLGSASIS